MSKEILKKVRQIEIRTKNIVNDFFGGDYHSNFKGRGMTFSEVREYVPGDDVRSIDWNVTARTGKPHIKIFEEERELSVLILIDVSSSGVFGSKKDLKIDLGVEIAAMLSFSAIKNNDKVGLALFSDKIEIDQIIIDGININYFFTLNKSLKVEDNVKPLKENISKGNNSSSSSSKEFIIKKLDIKNAKISANSEKLNINQQISLKDMSFENVGNTKDSKDYKTILKDIFNKAVKSAKNKVLSGNTGNAIDKLQNIDENKIKEKIKEEINQTKDKVKDKIKNLLN